jgi:hypothetical protein
LEICYTQEDLWVLDGILQVIKRTNGDARENFQAPIKQIDWIRLGKAASADAGDVLGAYALLPSAPAANPYAAGGGGMPMGVEASVAIRPDPADGRYVDSDYKPVPSSRLRSAMKSSAPSDALFAVAKRIPVQFRVQMDPTKIASLITECGNNSLLIEVKQVRINGKESVGGSSGGGGFGGGGGDAGYTGGGDTGGGAGGPPASPYGGSASAEATASTKSGDVPVEVYGIVYLFNPVDIQKLGLDKVKAETELDTTVDGAPPPKTTVEGAAPNDPAIGDPSKDGAAPAIPQAPVPAPENPTVSEVDNRNALKPFALLVVILSQQKC